MSSSVTLYLNDGSVTADATQYCCIIGKLQYFSFNRLDIYFSINNLSQFIHAPTNCHWKIIKYILLIFATLLIIIDIFLSLKILVYIGIVMPIEATMSSKAANSYSLTVHKLAGHLKSNQLLLTCLMKLNILLSRLIWLRLIASKIFSVNYMYSFYRSVVSNVTMLVSLTYIRILFSIIIWSMLEACCSGFSFYLCQGASSSHNCYLYLYRVPPSSLQFRCDIPMSNLRGRYQCNGLYNPQRFNVNPLS